MPSIIAVEPQLSGIKEMLQRQGYQVVSSDNLEQNIMAVVVGGTDNNLMNIQDTVVRAPVIDATGKTPEEILTRIRQLEK